MSKELYKPIHEEGYWDCSHGEWSINYSDILTALIQMAGSYVDRYASDLFIIWKYDVEKWMREHDWKGDIIRFGFRDFGVDNYCNSKESNPLWAGNKYGNYYYRRIVKLEIKIEGDRIIMELSQEK